MFPQAAGTINPMGSKLWRKVVIVQTFIAGESLMARIICTALKNPLANYPSNSTLMMRR